MLLLRCSGANALRRRGRAAGAAVRRHSRHLVQQLVGLGPRRRHAGQAWQEGVRQRMQRRGRVQLRHWRMPVPQRCARGRRRRCALELQLLLGGARRQAEDAARLCPHTLPLDGGRPPARVPFMWRHPAHQALCARRPVPLCPNPGFGGDDCSKRSTRPCTNRFAGRDDPPGVPVVRASRAGLGHALAPPLPHRLGRAPFGSC